MVIYKPYILAYGWICGYAGLKVWEIKVCGFFIFTLQTLIEYNRNQKYKIVKGAI
jgi:hypothetical protein